MRNANVREKSTQLLLQLVHWIRETVQLQATFTFVIFVFEYCMQYRKVFS